MDVDVAAQPNVNGDEDPYKPEGHIQFKLDKLTEFAAFTSDDRGRRLSEPVYIRGLPWRILALSRRAGRPREARVPVLGFFLQCNADNPDPTWSCTASYTLKVLPQDEGREAHERRIGHRFQANENDWGFAQFMTIEELKDPQRGWYRQADDSILLASDVLAEVPQGVNYEAKRGTIKFPSASPTLLSSVEQIGGFEWQVFPPEPDSPSHLVIVCNQQQSTTQQQQQQQQLWFCEAKVQVRVKVTEVHWDNVGGGRAVKHCFNSFNKFNIRFKQPGERRVVQPQNIEVDIEVKWSAINLPKLDADLTVNYSGKSTLIPVNRSFLAIHSNYFNNLFCGNWREQSKPGNSAASGELENLRQLNEDEHFDMTAFQFMINATHVMGPMLTKELPFPRWSTEDMQTKLALLKLAVKYDLPVCAEFAKRALIARRSNCTELLELLEVADGLGFCDLKQHSLQHVKAAEYCSKNFGQNCEIRGRLRKETRQELDARIEATTANFSAQTPPPINVVADVDCFDVKTNAQ